MKKYDLYRSANNEKGFLPQKFDSYKFKPKNNFKYDGISVSKLRITDPYLISNIIKRKTKIKLNSYLYFLMELLEDDSTSDDDMTLFIDEVQRYKQIIINKYSKYLDKEYIMDLLLKTNFVEQEIQSKIALNNQRKRGRHY